MMDKDPNLVLGLIWVLILAYQHIKKDDQLKWVKSRLAEIPGVTITDLTGSFQDGMAFAHLVHSFKPDAIDLELIKALEIPQRLETSFQKAEEHLGIPRLLEPADCFPERPNEQSIMTYLSFFHNVSRVEAGETLDLVVPTPPATPSKFSELKPSRSGAIEPASPAKIDARDDIDDLRKRLESAQKENTDLKEQLPTLQYAAAVKFEFKLAWWVILPCLLV